MTLKYYNPLLKPLDVVYQDDDILVLNKPSGLLTVPGKGDHLSDCLERRAKDTFSDALTVHRLDMDTSGLMIFARTRESQRTLSMAFEKRAVEKGYEALIAGSPEMDRGTVNAAIAKYSLKRPLRHLDPDGREAITHWQVIARSDTYTRVSLAPETGRSHQLRLHMASLGHPILGDVFYGDPESHARLCLHAKSLSLNHPHTGVKIQFDSPAPF